MAVSVKPFQNEFIPIRIFNITESDLWTNTYLAAVKIISSMLVTVGIWLILQSVNISKRLFVASSDSASSDSAGIAVQIFLWMI